MCETHRVRCFGARKETLGGADDSGVVDGEQLDCLIISHDGKGDCAKLAL